MIQIYTPRLQTVSFGFALATAFLIGSYSNASAAAPLPDFAATTFSNPTKITNPWLALPVGREFEYEGETEDGTENIEIEIDGSTKKVNGITTLIYRDIVWVDGELVEDTRDYLAQDDAGNVWYLGEDVDNYEDGTLVDHEGSWQAGKDGAKPGYWMPKNPTVGMKYRQEYYAGEAEDEAEVLSIKETVKIGLGTFKNCLKTKDTTPLEPDVLEYKYYCKGDIKGLVLEEKPEDSERIELTEFETEDGTDDDEDEKENELEFDEDEDEDEENDDVRGNDSHNNRGELQQQLIALLKQLIALLNQNR